METKKGGIFNIKIHLEARSDGVKLFRSDNETSPRRREGWVDTADTVVIGGGVVGASVAYHLAKGEQARNK